MDLGGGIRFDVHPPQHTLSVEDGPRGLELREYLRDGEFKVLVLADCNWPHALESLVSLRDWLIRKRYAPAPPLELRGLEEFHAQPRGTRP